MLNQAVDQLTEQNVNLEAKMATTPDEIEQAYRLRYEVFVNEENNLALQNESKMEFDAYDSYCDHLIVKNHKTNEVVGTYRVMLSEKAQSGIGYYSATEFDLSGFQPFFPYSMELGRSCVHQDYRNGVVIQMLWREIARYVQQNHVQYLIGCASAYHLGKSALNEIFTLLYHKKMITDRFGVKPLPTHRIESIQLLSEPLNEKEVLRQCPPLLKGYYWLGAEIGGEPAFDPIFQTTDFFIVLETNKITKRYKSFLK
jgi:putative hemolysin